MSQRLRPCLLASAAALLLTVAISAPAQTPAPDTSAPQHRPHRPHPKPVNLQVLPKDLTGDQVVDIMRKFSGDLGVECDYCHARNPHPTPTTGHLDFASDANPVKDRARLMLRMSMDINQNFIAQLQNPPATNKVTCGTCHRGAAKPTVFVPPPDDDHPAAPPSTPPHP